MFSILCLLAVAVTASAQSSTAVLSHNGEITTFYGEQALVNAQNAAVTGDVITLSSGRFNGTNIKKPITIRGMSNGIQYDGDTTQIEPTVIISTIEVNSEADSTCVVTLEGLKMSSYRHGSSNHSDVQIIKCNIDGGAYVSGHGNLYITHSLCYGRFHMDSGSKYDQTDLVLSAVSSYFADVYFYDSDAYDKAQKVFQNCVLNISCMRYYTTLIKNSIVSRSYSVTSTVSLSNPTIYNSLINLKDFQGGYSTSSEFHDYTVSDNTGIFKDGTLFELTDNAKTLYYGSDGKQVGMYGGVLPFNPVPTYPRITTFNVAPQTTADGKLSIDIVVK